MMHGEAQAARAQRLRQLGSAPVEKWRPLRAAADQQTHGLPIGCGPRNRGQARHLGADRRAGEARPLGAAAKLRAGSAEEHAIDHAAEEPVGQARHRVRLVHGGGDAETARGEHRARGRVSAETDHQRDAIGGQRPPRPPDAGDELPERA
jgi:hypothetical protein